MITYWLKYSGQFVSAVRFKPNATDQEVKSHAMAQHDRAPLTDAYETPIERSNKIWFAEVITYPEGN